MGKSWKGKNMEKLCKYSAHFEILKKNFKKHTKMSYWESKHVCEENNSCAQCKDISAIYDICVIQRSTTESKLEEILKYYLVILLKHYANLSHIIVLMYRLKMQKKTATVDSWVKENKYILYVTNFKIVSKHGTPRYR